ncbi:hypothetical protein KCU88_g172, partial [Aureobasidium melanogenum]
MPDGGLTAVAALGKVRRVVVVTIDLSIVLVITVLRTKDGWTDRAGKMFNVVLAVERSDASEVVCLAERELAGPILCVNRKELGCDDLAAVGALEAIQVKCTTERTYELTGDFPALPFVRDLLLALLPVPPGDLFLPVLLLTLVSRCAYCAVLASESASVGDTIHPLLVCQLSLVVKVWNCLLSATHTRPMRDANCGKKTEPAERGSGSEILGISRGFETDFSIRGRSLNSAMMWATGLWMSGTRRRRRWVSGLKAASSDDKGVNGKLHCNEPVSQSVQFSWCSGWRAVPVPCQRQ